MPEPVDLRALDRALHELLVGQCPHPEDDLAHCGNDLWKCDLCGGVIKWGETPAEPPLYSSTWEGLGLVVEALAQKGWLVEMEVWSGGRGGTATLWKRLDDGWIGKAPTVQEDAESVCLAVALAARKALEGEKR